MEIHVLFHKDYMEQSIWIPWNSPHGILWKNTIKCVVKNRVNIKNRTLNSMVHHMCKQEDILTAVLSDHCKIIN